MFFCPFSACPLVCSKSVGHTPATTTTAAMALELCSILFCAKSLWGSARGAAAEASVGAVEPAAGAGAAMSEFHLGLF